MMFKPSPKANGPREPHYLDLQRIAEVERKAADLDFALQRCSKTPDSDTARKAIRAHTAKVIGEMLTH